MSLCEIGKIELDGGNVCKPKEFCSVISRVVDTCQCEGGRKDKEGR